uniref:Uncharacterized protein n=1 Tax=viral metagenome TaxID=1070528 RepID=A0A6M3ING3_9ZZZZ
MNKIISQNTVFPTRIKKQDFWAMPIITDYMSLKPKPEKDVLLILGDGFNLLQDIEEFYKIAQGIVEYDTMCVNYSALICPHPYQHFAAGDAHLPDMKAVAKQVPAGVLKHAWNPGCFDFDVRWIRNGRGGWTGTSTNLAFKIGLALDYTRIILAGCPMDNSGNWYKTQMPENDIKKNKDHRHHIWKWYEIATRPVGRFLRSMSGNTADLFGRPTREWLCHIPENPEKEN